MRSRSDGPGSDQASARRERTTAAEPGFVVLIDEGTPVGSQAETVRFGPPERRPARTVAAVATAAVLASGAVLLARHSDDQSSPSSAVSTPTRSSSFDRDPGFGGGTRIGGAPASVPAATSPRPPGTARVTFASGQSVPAISVPEAGAVGVVVGPLPARYSHHSAAVAGPAALPNTLVAGRTYAVTFRYYAAQGSSRTSTGHVSAPFATQWRCPADFRIRPGRTYTVNCRVRVERGTDSIAFLVTEPAHSKWEAGASVLLVAR